MNSALRWVFAAAFLSVTAACAAPEGDDTASSQDSVVATPAPGTEMLIYWRAREELATALGKTVNELDFGNVVVPGVLFVQHQYSIAALRLEAPSWSTVTGLPTANPGPGSWGIDQSHGVVFPRRLGMRNDAGFVASEKAAASLFNAMVAATETTEQVAPNVSVVTRASANKSFTCTKTISTGQNPRTEFDCIIAGVSEVGGPGLIWQH